MHLITLSEMHLITLSEIIAICSTWIQEYPYTLCHSFKIWWKIPWMMMPF